jgi:hypothetical protein
MTTRRITFNLKKYAEDLNSCLMKDSPELLEDVVERYDNFLKRADDKIRKSSEQYLMNHELVKNNKVMKEYIFSSHYLYF